MEGVGDGFWLLWMGLGLNTIGSDFGHKYIGWVFDLGCYEKGGSLVVGL